MLQLRLVPVAVLLAQSRERAGQSGQRADVGEVPRPQPRRQGMDARLQRGGRVGWRQQAWCEELALLLGGQQVACRVGGQFLAGRDRRLAVAELERGPGKAHPGR